MDRELWKTVLGAVKRAARRVDRERKRRRCAYPLWLVAAMYLWCVWHDRPLCWACDRSHYGRLFRPRKLPSVSQFTRRVKEGRFQRVLQLAHDELAQRGLVTSEGYLDGKPLLVSAVSKDRDAARGRACGGWAKGYKLHAVWCGDAAFPLQSKVRHEEFGEGTHERAVVAGEASTAR